MKSGKISAGTISAMGMLTAVALVLGYVEHLIPITTIPGIKLGLSNTVLLYALYLMDGGSAFVLMLMKVVLGGFLYGGVSAMLYSLAGGVLSLGAMCLVRRVPGVGIPGVSVLGAVMHNMGQLAAACLIVESRAVLAYLPVLLVSAVMTGTLTGVVAKYAVRGLQCGGFGRAKDAMEVQK